MSTFSESLEIAQDLLQSTDIQGKIVMEDDNQKPTGLVITSKTEITLNECKDKIRLLTERYQLLVCENCNYNGSKIPRKVDNFYITDFQLQDPWHEDIFINAPPNIYTITSLSKKKSDFRLQDTYYGIKSALMEIILDLSQNDNRLRGYVESMSNNSGHFNFAGYDNTLREYVQTQYLDFVKDTFMLLPENKKYAIPWKSGAPKSLFHINQHNGTLLHGRPYLEKENIENYGHLSSMEHLFLDRLLPVSD